MSSRFSKQRLTAFKKQSGRCYYCKSPMWQNNPEEFAIKHGISKSAAARFQCTAEHLLARCDGGKDQESNIVAACLFCNKTRHHKRKNPPNPTEYRKYIKNRLNKGKWFPNSLRHVLSV